MYRQILNVEDIHQVGAEIQISYTQASKKSLAKSTSIATVTTIATAARTKQSEGPATTGMKKQQTAESPHE